MAFGLGGLVALSAAGKVPKTYQEYQERQAELDEKQADALSLAAVGNAFKLSGTGNIPGMPPTPQAPQTAPPNFQAQAQPPAPGQPPPPPPPAPGTAPPGVNFPPPAAAPGGMAQQSQPPAWATGSMPQPPPFQQPYTQAMGLGTGPGMPPGQPRPMPGAPNAPPMVPGQQPPMQASLGARGLPPPSPAPGSVAGAAPSALGGGPSQGGGQPQQPAQDQELTGAMKTMVQRGLVPQFGFHWQDLAKQIAQANPGIPPAILGRAIMKMAPIMNQNSMMEFRQLEFDQREREFKERKEEFDKRMEMEEKKLRLQTEGTLTDEDKLEESKQLANYDKNPQAIPIRRRDQAIADATKYAQSIGKTYAPGEFGNVQASIKAFDIGQPGQQTRNIGTAYRHLDTLEWLGKDLKNFNVPAMNEIKNWIKTNIQGAPEVTTFDQAKQIIASELIKGVAGQGGGGQAERMHAAEGIRAASSPAQLKKAIADFRELLQGQLTGLEKQYKAGTKGRTDFYTRYADFGLPGGEAGASAPAGKARDIGGGISVIEEP